MIGENIHKVQTLGRIEGQANNLSDETGGSGSPARHNSAMTHLFAVPS